MGKRYDPGVEMDTTLRAAYAAVRQHGSPVKKGQAFYLWRRFFGDHPTTFFAAPDGTVWRSDKATLLAELRLLMLRQGMPVGFVGRFDRSL